MFFRKIKTTYWKQLHHFLEMQKARYKVRFFKRTYLIAKTVSHRNFSKTAPLISVD